jgi:hypothetical protein
VGPVHWGSYPGDLLERVMSVLLFQERPTAWRRRPSQGDGGLDLGEPTSDGYHVYQIKGFTGSMTSSRRRQVRQSLQQILDDPRVDRPVTGWSLVVPLDPTSEDEWWFRQLTAQAPFPCAWKGLGLPRFDGQGWWLGQATCVRTSWSVVSNSSGVM